MTDVTLPGFLVERCYSCEFLLQGPYIFCSDCRNVVLCLKCFACGSEIGNHRCNHDYSVVNNRPAVFEGSRFSCEDEQRLLILAERYSLGWHSICEAFNSGSNLNDDQKLTCDEFKSHFLDYFVTGNIGLIDDVENPTTILSPVLTFYEKPPKIADKITWPKEKCGSDTCDCSLTMKAPQLEGVPEKVVEGPTMSHLEERVHFEKEWRCEADESLSKLLSFPDDTRTDHMLIAAKVSSYACVVKERSRRKFVADEHNLLQLFKKFKSSEKLLKHSSKLKSLASIRKRAQIGVFRNFAQFLPRHELFDLITDIRQEYQLVQRIRSLREQRRYQKRVKGESHENDSTGSTTTQDDTSLLSELEQNLCKQLQVPGDLYLRIKTIILNRRLHVQRGKDLSEVPTFDEKLESVIYRFLKDTKVFAI